MSITAEALRELHRIHTQLGDLRERLARGPKQVLARESNVKRLEEALAKAQADAKATRVSADQKQLSLKSGEAKIADLQVKLNGAKTNREYQALKDQIAADEMANSVLADEIIEGLDKIEEMQRLVVEAQQFVAQAKEELGKARTTLESQQSIMQADVARLDAELTTAEAKLPDEFREAYQRIAKVKGSDAMAQIENDSCGGCNQRITPQRLNELRLQRVVVCTSCGRLLYLPEDTSVGGK
jgi:predicted  nucleic acid-binding Zn-ribbon protein